MKHAPALPSPKMFSSLVLGSLLLCSVNGTAMASAPEATGIEQAMQRHALFATLVEDKPGFRDEWEGRLRLQLQLDARLSADTHASTDAGVQAGMALAMDAAKPYLMRASDEASNHFLSSLSKLIAEGEKDPEVCLAYVETGDSDPRSTRRREQVEERLGPLLRHDLLQSLSAVVASGRNGEKRVLTREELPHALQPVILAMAARHGTESLQGLGRINDRQAPPAARCRAMAQMLAAFREQPEQRRAMLARTLFSGALPRVE